MRSAKQPAVRQQDVQPVVSTPAQTSNATLTALCGGLLVSLRVRSIRTDDLALAELSELALRDITADVRSRALPSRPQPCVRQLELERSCFGGYSLLDLRARVIVNLRLRRVDETGTELHRLPADALRRILLYDVQCG
jgi:hypothetical protein